MFKGILIVQVIFALVALFEVHQRMGKDGEALFPPTYSYEVTKVTLNKAQ